MCYEALKGNLAKVDGDEILAKYKLWFENQKTYQFNQFIKGYLLEMENFNQVFTENHCKFSFQSQVFNEEALATSLFGG